ncbi:MAG: DUF805 domain-containing protein [Chthoniobacterales bacterium]|nr:DUF805 domain-containing protein [Chthoniobacterales bacterium]
MNYYIDAWKNYVNFQGRARRKAYWMFVLFNIIVAIILSIIDNVIGTGGLLGGIYSLAVLLPGIALGVRRLHDIGKSGWWLLIALVPLIGAIVLLIFAVMDSQPGENQYGPNPKGA